MKSLKHHYETSFIKGNHGIWLFIKKDNKTIFEQAGLTLDEACQWIKQIIHHEETYVPPTKEQLANSKWNKKKE